jgi:hypothetical protein
MTTTDAKTVQMTPAALKRFEQVRYDSHLYPCHRCGVHFDPKYDEGWTVGQFDSKTYCSHQCAKNATFRDETSIGHDEYCKCGATRD